MGDEETAPSDRGAQTIEIRDWDWWSWFLQRQYYGAPEEEGRWQQTVSDVVSLLSLETPGRVLDLGSGCGELLFGLAARGFDAIGIEASAKLAGECQDIAARRVASARFVTGSMFETLPSGPFDAVTCLNTSFGYGSNEENQQLIPTIARELRAGGALLLDVIVADEAESFGCWEDDLDGGLLTVENSWDADRHCMISHPSWSSETTQFVAPSPEYVRLYSMHEIEEMLDDAGLRHRRLPRGPGRTARNEHGPNHPATWVARRR